jgi:lysophospholipase L1-like esterase
MTAWVAATPEWDEAAGFSFWVKGDGSTHWGGLELIDGNDYGLRYGYCFPIDSTEWTRVVVPWRDLIPELAGPLVAAKGGFAPSAFRNIWFGKWFYWRERPAHSYAIDQVVLEKTIDPDRADATADRAGAARVLAKLKGRKPVTIVTMGDSLSDKRHWANRQVLWSELLVGKIKEKYGAEATLVNPAIGGTTLTQNLILMPQWLKGTPKPDLVTVWFGFNDWDSGVRGERFKEYLRLAVDRIRRMTGGEADVLLMTTCPAHARWDTPGEMADAVREVAREKKTALADVAAEFHKVAGPDEALGQGYWVSDKTHLGPKGHEVAAAAVLKAIETSP